MKILVVPAVLFGIFAYSAYSAPHTVSRGMMGLERKPAPGYQWSKPDSWASYDTVWTPGATDDSLPHMTSADTQDSWKPDAGYRLSDDAASAVGLAAQWSAGSAHPDHAHIHAAATEGQWEPDSGYQFVAANSLDVVPIPTAAPVEQASSGPSTGALVVGGIAAVACAVWEACRNTAIDVGKGVAEHAAAEALTR